MQLSPREIDHLTILSNAGLLAQRRLARGCRLSQPEATALIAHVVMEKARDGKSTVAQLMDSCRRLIGIHNVMPAVPHLIHEVQVECTFPDGTKLVTVPTPITLDYGDLAEALYGSFLPVPSNDLFAPSNDTISLLSTDEINDNPFRSFGPGHIWNNPTAEPITLNPSKSPILLSVTNTCDRPIQVGSHYHFIECNPYLSFDRALSYGRRLNICSGTAVRFEPGERKTVSLVEIGGAKVIRGGNNLVDGPVAEVGRPPAYVMDRIEGLGFCHVAENLNTPTGTMTSSCEHTKMERSDYAKTFGPTAGDHVRLGDTALVVEVEYDLVAGIGVSNSNSDANSDSNASNNDQGFGDGDGYGDEVKFGGGKVIRDGMGQASGLTSTQTLDLVITNALIIDYTGIYKADVGINDGTIVGIGKAGNPDTQDHIHPNLIIGVNTEVIAGEGSILTAGGVDTHIHYICPQLANEAIASGLTTMLGGGTGPATGTCATTCTPSPAHLCMMMQATDCLPLNFGFTGKGNSSKPQGLEDAILAGACGLKLHEDWGTTPATIDSCLSVAEEHDVQVTIHTDTLNESTCCEGSLNAMKGRTIHTYHSEGAGGGHAPDIIRVCGAMNVIPSSTNPTRPYTSNTIDEHLDMLMVCHHLDKSLKEDVAFAESRIRGETIAAEDVLHDLGAISIISSDSQAMGRVGEVITRTWQTAHKMKVQRGQLKEDQERCLKLDHDNGNDNNGHGPFGLVDNERVKRYIAKYTINPCIAHGFGDVLGSVEVGKMADLCLWSPAFFGAKPKLILKGGHIAWAQMGDPNASIPTVEPVYMRPQFVGISPLAAAKHSLVFVSKLSIEKGVIDTYGLQKTVHAVKKCRGLTKKDMKLNDATPDIKVDPETFQVTADGEHLTCAPLGKLPLAQQYFMF